MIVDQEILDAFALLKRISLLSASEEDRAACERDWLPRHCRYEDVLRAMTYLRDGFEDEMMYDDRAD